MELIKRCKVCDDFAYGLSYNGLWCCVACQTFFCRNSTNYEKLKCRFNGTCKIDFQNRRKCAKCRMDKCIQSAGMKLKMKSSTNSRSWHKLLYKIDQFLEDNIRKNLITFDTNLSDTNNFGTSKNIKSQSINLIQYELKEIDKVLKAFEIFGYEKASPVIRKPISLGECMQGPEIYVRRAIAFCKQFDTFNLLESQYQMTLLKLYSFEIMTIRFLFNFDPTTNSILMFADNEGKESLIINCELAKRHIKNKQLNEENKRLGNIFRAALDYDETSCILFCTVLLFRPREGIPCIESMRHQYYFYSALLMRHLEHKYKSVRVANRKYANIMDQIQTIETIKANKRVEMNGFNDLQVPQLVQELHGLV